MKTKRGHPRLDALAFVFLAMLQRTASQDSPRPSCTAGAQARPESAVGAEPTRSCSHRRPFGSASDPSWSSPRRSKNKKIGSQCNFFAITDCLEIRDCGLRRKSPGNLLYCGPISLFGNGKESAIAKKLQKCRDFCFCSGLIVETRRISREEHGVLPVKAAARHYRCY